MNSLIAIILVVQKLVLYKNSGEWRLGGGGGWAWLVGTQNSVPSVALPKQ